MSSYDSITHGILREILAEIKAMRKDYKEGQVCYVGVGEPEKIVKVNLLQDAFHTSYER